jgi:hypothetical protein
MVIFDSDDKLTMINALVKKGKDPDLDSYKLDQIEIILNINEILENKDKMELGD